MAVVAVAACLLSPAAKPAAPGDARSPAATTADRASYPGVYRGYTTERFDGVVRTTQHVAVRDGARLAVTVYRPANGAVASGERLPVLFSFTPYLTRRIDASGAVVGTIERDTKRNRAFVDLARYGYVVAVADVRGKGSSFGVRAAYADRLEGEDGADLVQWLAAQPWANGQVGMFGCSYVGGTQWATARNVPPALKAIFPQAAQFDSYRNVRRGGIAGQFNTRYQDVNEDAPTAPVDGDANGALKAAALKQHERNGQMLDIVSSLVFRDDRTADDVEYWSISSPYPRLAQLRAAGIATYSWGNWRDEPADQSLLSFENLRGGEALTKLLMGPGGHCDTDTIDSFQEHLRFFDHVLKGVDNGIDREPPVAFKTIGLPEADAWRFTNEAPAKGATPTRLHLAPGGTFATRAPRAGRDEYAVTYGVGCQPPAWSVPGVGNDPPQKVGTHVLPPPGFWACVNASVAKTYATPPFDREAWLSGFSTLKLTLASSSSEAYVFAYLEDVAPDGSAELVAHGRLRASMRRLGEAPYRNFGLPWSTGRRADASPLTPGRPAVLEFELSPTSRIVAKGHRLRLSLTGADQRQRDLARIAENPAPRWTISTGADASYLEVALAPVDQLLATTRSIRAGR